MQYCCYCGNKLTLKLLYDGSNEKYCQLCDHVFFNSPSPAIIVAVTNGSKILLTRSIEWAHSYWGLIAGHIKSSETAEHAVKREILEEVGILIHNVTILRTFIHQENLLMIAFKACTSEHKISLSQELAAATWFNLAEPLPLRATSIASQVVRQLYPDVQFLNE
jgi:NAD+ diphosphatase